MIPRLSRLLPLQWNHAPRGGEARKPLDLHSNRDGTKEPELAQGCQRLDLYA